MNASKGFVRFGATTPIASLDNLERLKQAFDEAGVELEIKTEDKLRVAITEAALWIREGAPGRALDVLEAALKLR